MILVATRLDYGGKTMGRLPTTTTNLIAWQAAVDLLRLIAYLMRHQQLWASKHEGLRFVLFSGVTSLSTYWKLCIVVFVCDNQRHIG